MEVFDYKGCYPIKRVKKSAFLTCQPQLNRISSVRSNFNFPEREYCYPRVEMYPLSGLNLPPFFSFHIRKNEYQQVTGRDNQIRRKGHLAFMRVLRGSHKINFTF